jgi:hypothetical protein
MRLPKFPIFVVFALVFLFFSSVWAQEKSEREIEVHKNLKLIVLAATPEVPADIASQFKDFLPILEAALKESTTDQSDECSMTLRVSPGVREVGAAKVKRATAHITAFRRNSKQEYVGNMILYSYINSGPLNKDETGQFLKKQILEPAECRKTE